MLCPLPVKAPFLLIVLSVALFALTGRLDPNGWRMLVAQRLYRQGLVAQGRHDYAAAESLFRASMDGYKGHAPQYALVAECLADLLQETGRLSESDQLFECSLRNYDTAYGPHDQRTMSVTNKLANNYLAEHRYADAERLYGLMVHSPRLFPSEGLKFDGVELDSNKVYTRIFSKPLARTTSLDALPAEVKRIFSDDVPRSFAEGGEQWNNNGMRPGPSRYFVAGLYSSECYVLWYKAARPPGNVDEADVFVPNEGKYQFATELVFHDFANSNSEFLELLQRKQYADEWSPASRCEYASCPCQSVDLPQELERLSSESK